MNPIIPIIMIVFALAAMLSMIMYMDDMADRVGSCRDICNDNNMTFLDIDDAGCGCVGLPGEFHYFLRVG